MTIIKLKNNVENLISTDMIRSAGVFDVWPNVRRNIRAKVRLATRGTVYRSVSTRVESSCDNRMWAEEGLR